MADRVKGTYQMLWDCQFCGTRKLLGLTHRHCPTCGAVQDPKSRYFPSDAEKIAVEDHVFFGADLVCPACQAPSSARAKHCGNCGSPLEGATGVQRRADQAPGQVPGQAATPVPAAAQPPKKKSRKALVGLGCGCLSLVGVAATVVIALLSWSRPTTATAVGHSWSREIEVEAYRTVQESGWCDSKPSSAYDVSKTEKERSTRKVADGEDCTTVRVDNRDGTFSEKEQCTTRYRDEPVYDDCCEYTVNRWMTARSVRAAGDDAAMAPAWPLFTLAAVPTALPKAFLTFLP